MMAAAYGYARRHGASCAIHLAHATPHSSERYDETVFSAFGKEMSQATHVFKEAAADATGVLLSIPFDDKCAHIMLYGYFQHEGYLGQYADDFIRSLSLPHSQSQDLQNTCFIHVRRNDYLDPRVAKVHYVDLSEYYPKAIEYVRSKRPDVRFLLFSDDVDWCREQSMFQGMDVCEEPREVDALVVMSRCKVGGIAANSSFSWWGAFLNRSPEKIVVFPSQWFAPGAALSGNPAFEGSVTLR